MYYFIEPEVAGGWGDSVIADTSVHPPVVEKLHYEFDGWLGDELLETFPCYIVSESLMQDMVNSGLTGAEFDTVTTSVSPQFYSSFEAGDLPSFFWMKIKRTDDPVDVKISKDNRLMVSDAALAVLRKHRVSNADITPE